jgi:hypothetical protein
MEIRSPPPSGRGSDASHPFVRRHLRVPGDSFARSPIPASISAVSAPAVAAGSFALERRAFEAHRPPVTSQPVLRQPYSDGRQHG